MKLEFFQINERLFEAQSKMREEFKKQFKDSLKVKFSIDWETINKKLKSQIEVNTSAEWPITPNIDINTYREMGNKDISDEERNETFVQLFKNKSFNLLENEWDQIVNYSFGGWKDLLSEAKEIYFNGQFKVVVPLLFSYLEAFLAQYYTEGNPKGISKELVQKFTKKYIDKYKLEFDYYLLESNQKLLSEVIFNRGGFGEQEPVFNRSCILHGRHDPDEWKEIDVIKLIAILSSLTFVNGIYKQV